MKTHVKYAAPVAMFVAACSFSKTPPDSDAALAPLVEITPLKDFTATYACQESGAALGRSFKVVIQSGGQLVFTDGTKGTAPASVVGALGYDFGDPRTAKMSTPPAGEGDLCSVDVASSSGAQHIAFDGRDPRGLKKLHDDLDTVLANATHDAVAAPATDAGAPCDTLTRRQCLASTSCTLYATDVRTKYECRASTAPCEIGHTQGDKDACSALASCQYEPGSCYCPCSGYGSTKVPDEAGKACSCVCSGGAPGRCSFVGGIDAGVVKDASARD